MGKNIKMYFFGVFVAAFVGVSQVVAGPSVSALWAKSFLAERGGDYSSALNLHNQIINVVGSDYNTTLRAGWLYYMNGNYDTALTYYERATDLADGAISPLYGQLNCYKAMERFSKSIQVAKSILVISKFDYIANHCLASIYYKEKKFALSGAYYLKLHRLYPEDQDLASGLAWCYLEQGEVRHAITLFKYILMVSPNNTSAARGMKVCDQLSKK